LTFSDAFSDVRRPSWTSHVRHVRKTSEKIMNKSQKIAFVGPGEYCQAMRFAGFECFAVLSQKETQDLIKKLEQEDYALIFVSQDVAPGAIGLDRVVSLPGIVKTSDPHYLKQEIIKAIGGEINLSLK